MGSLLGPGFVPGNRVTSLLNGDEVFPAMLEAIRSARRTITFESYIYWSSSIGHQFTAALAERARAGVRTHVMIDWAGSQKVDQDDIKRLRQAGVEVVFYRPLHLYQLDHLNHRTHRKLLIVDGRVGFTGGMGVADKWLGHAQDADHWRDSHFRVEGAGGRAAPGRVHGRLVRDPGRRCSTGPAITRTSTARAGSSARCSGARPRAATAIFASCFCSPSPRPPGGF